MCLTAKPGLWELLGLFVGRLGATAPMGRNQWNSLVNPKISLKYPWFMDVKGCLSPKKWYSRFWSITLCLTVLAPKTSGTRWCNSRNLAEGLVCQVISAFWETHSRKLYRNRYLGLTVMFVSLPWSPHWGEGRSYAAHSASPTASVAEETHCNTDRQVCGLDSLDSNHI